MSYNNNIACKTSIGTQLTNSSDSLKVQIKFKQQVKFGCNWKNGYYWIVKLHFSIVLNVPIQTTCNWELNIIKNWITLKEQTVNVVLPFPTSQSSIIASYSIWIYCVICLNYQSNVGVKITFFKSIHSFNKEFLTFFDVSLFNVIFFSYVTWKAKTDTNALPFNGRNRLLSV